MRIFGTAPVGSGVRVGVSSALRLPKGPGTFPFFKGTKAELPVKIVYLIPIIAIVTSWLYDYLK